jgi:hypothetical protein
MQRQPETAGLPLQPQAALFRNSTEMDWRRVAGLTVLFAAVAIPAAILGLPLAVRGFVRGVVLLLDACVWVAMSMSTGANMWSLGASVARSIVAALATPMASGILLGLVASCMSALYLLQRLLGSEEESSK